MVNSIFYIYFITYLIKTVDIHIFRIIIIYKNSLKIDLIENNRDFIIIWHLYNYYHNRKKNNFIIK